MITLTIEMTTYGKDRPLSVGNVLAHLKDSGCDMASIMVTPEVEGVYDEERGRTVGGEEPKLTVSFRDPLGAATYLTLLSADPERAAMFKMFWGGE